MSIPNFPSTSHRPLPAEPSPILKGVPSTGAGNHLPVWLLALCGAFTAVATGISIMSIALQLKNYRKPALQRAVVRIMVMVPLYAISSLIAIFSLEAAFFIDAIRDLYEAFVIYTFLQLLITYLGGERSLLITLHGRQPIPHPFPVNLFLSPMDVSDPWVLLNLKRGVLQYVQVKPLLVVATIVLKATGTYQEGRFATDSGYTYVSIVYNISICLSLYCLAMFWVAVNKDLKPFRPVPKFLCVKGILFFSFWQSIGISLLVAIGAIRRVGPYTDAEHMSLAIVDSLICFEMPIFAIAHQYAFQASDYTDNNLVYAARLPFIYAFRDAFGFKDVWEDTKDTFKGRGVSYQAYEPAEGGIHYGLGRQRRIRAGLRYAKGGKAKYWVPTPGDEAKMKGQTGPITSLKRRVDERLAWREGYAPLLPQQASRVLHESPSYSHEQSLSGGFSSDSDSDAPSLNFYSADEEEDTLYERAKRIGYAGFPNVDVSKEEAKRKRREIEEGILAGRWTRHSAGNGLARDVSVSGGKKSKTKGKAKVYGAWADRVTEPRCDSSASNDLHTSNERVYDGENERSEEWSNPSHDSPSTLTDQRLHWTKKQLHKKISPSPLPSPFVPTSPFEIGDDGKEGDVDGPEQQTKKLPSDAVDLVKEDHAAVEIARERERRRGEPQTKAPAHVYRKILPNEQQNEQTIEEIQRVYAHNPDERGETADGLGEVVEQIETSIAIEPPRHLNWDAEDNPWV
ncbi:uncharacterized protein L203_100857 [Cryptococcus depauperatus CBS 7841]|uniref:Uncharacterized protein n=1 Tax=Cryptococcus depauperatus CBS 7841 TaxID=1295531 RepID=A0A1E3IZP0_9TREE|nr:hypothetical protein L203_00648 [Cryptococcus depauperatus CBS 7841]